MGYLAWRCAGLGGRLHRHHPFNTLELIMKTSFEHLDTLWDALHSYRAIVLTHPTDDKEWDDITYAMAAIAETLENTK